MAQLRYQNRATGVVFTVDEEADDLIDEMPALSGFNGRLNVARPDFYGREAVDAFAHLVSEVGGEVQILAGDAPDDPAGGESPSSSTSP